MNTLHLLIPQNLHDEVKEHAHHHKVSVSWLLRFILFNPHRFAIPKDSLKRPRKFDSPTHRVNLLLFDDKSYWLAFVRHRKGELAPMIRFLIECYLPLLADMDIHDPLQTKKVKSVKIYRMSSAYAYHVVGFEFSPDDYWPHSSQRRHDRHRE